LSVRAPGSLRKTGCGAIRALYRNCHKLTEVGEKLPDIEKKFAKKFA
jgi:hypothetical protein